VSVAAGYGGMWTLGVASTGVQGVKVTENFLGDALTWAGESMDLEPYERYVTASTQKMTANPGQVTGELTGRFVRSIGVENLPSVTAVASA
jgi:hypothetical protein